MSDSKPRSRNAGGHPTPRVVGEALSANGRAHPAFTEVDADSWRDSYGFSKSPAHLFFSLRSGPGPRMSSLLCAASISTAMYFLRFGGYPSLLQSFAACSANALQSDFTTHGTHASLHVVTEALPLGRKRCQLDKRDFIH